MNKYSQRGNRLRVGRQCDPLGLGQHLVVRDRRQSSLLGRSGMGRQQDLRVRRQSGLLGIR